MTKLIVVYNTCGIKVDGTAYYIPAIESILKQSFKDFKLVISGCKLAQKTKDALLSNFKGKVSFNWIDEIYPVTVTFNLSCLKAIEKFGVAEGYLYIDSGCQFLGRKDLQVFYDGFKKYDDCGMYAARVDDDSGYHDWFGVGRHTKDCSEDYRLFDNGDFVIPVGKTCNLHTQIFSKELVEFYRRPYFDILAGHSTESVFSFICAAIRSRFIICQDFEIHHEQLDCQSSGFDPLKWVQSGKSRHEHPYLIPSVMEIMGCDTARKLGLGYEELAKLVMHDESQYDANGYCINDELKTYIRDRLYLPESLLDYSKINCEFI